MNKIYKSIWSVSKGTYVAVSELARGKGKSSSCRLGGSQKTGCAASCYLQNNPAGKYIGAWVENYLPLSFRLSHLAVLISLGGIAGSAMAAAPQEGSGNGLAISTKNCANANANAAHLESIAIGCAANVKDNISTPVIDRFNPFEITEGLVYEPNSNYGPTALRKEAGIAIGSRSKVDVGAVALGGGTSSGAIGVAVGTWARAAHSGISVGSRSHAAGESSVAVGRQAVSKGPFAMSFGNVAAAEGDSSLAMGHSATAKGARSIAIGAATRNAWRIYQDNEVVPEDPARYSSFAAHANGDYSIALGSGTRADSESTIAFGTGARAVATDAIGIGSFSNAVSDGSIAFGYRAATNGDYSIALGAGARAESYRNIAIGTNSISMSNGSIVMGNGSYATGDRSIALGSGATVDGEATVVLGSDARASFRKAVALGAGSRADDEPTPVVNYIYTPATGTPLTKNFAGTNPIAMISVGNDDEQRQIQNVAAGRISDSSTDAINGSQLFVTNEMAQRSLNAVRTLNNIMGGSTTVNTESNEITLGSDIYVGSAKDNRQPADTKKVIESIEALGENKAQGADLANYLGGGSVLVTENGRATGAVTAPGYNLVDGKPSEEKSKNYNNVGDALSAINTAVTQPITFATDDGSTTDRKLGSTLKVLGGDTISTSMEGPDTLKIAAKTTTLSVNDGRVGVDDGDAAKGNLVTAESIANAINESHFNVNAGATADGTVSGNAQSPVKTGDTVNYIAGKNIKLTQVDKDFTFETKDDVSFNKVEIGTGGLTVQNGAPIDMGGNKITNVGDGSAPGDAVNFSQLDGVKTIADNAVAEAAKGWNLQANGDAATKVAPGDKVQFLDGTNINVTRNGNDLTIATWADLKADSLTINNGGPVFNVDGINMNDKKLTNVAAGTLSADSKDGVNASQLFTVGDSTAQALGGDSTFDPVTGKVTAGLKIGDKTFNNVNSALTAINDNVTSVATRGWDIAGANGVVGSVATGGQVQFLAGDTHTKVNVAQENGISTVTVSTAASPLQYSDTANANGQNAVGTPFVVTNSVTLVGKDAAAPVSLNNVAKATLSEDSLQAVNGQQLYGLGNSIANTLGGGTYFDADTGKLSTKIRVDGSEYNSVADALDNIGRVANGGWNLQLNNDTPQKVGSGATVGFNQGSNIQLTRDGNQVTVATAPNVTFESVKTDRLEGDVVSAKSYLGVIDGPALTQQGIDAAGKPISNVGPGDISEGSTDAVTGGQLYSLAGGTAAAINRLQSNLDRVAKDANAGSATAGAMANLPQAYLPGKSMFALATARYVGQQGFAAGLSKVSDNGNWIIKGSVSGNTRGKTMVGAGIGYQW